jgi:predicted permease
MINFRFVLRSLFKAPFITICAIVSIALGIGANTAMFSIFEQILLHPLPVKDPGRLVNLAASGPQFGMASCSNAGGCDEVFSYPMFQDLEKIQNVFTGIAAHFRFSANLAARGETQTGEGLYISGSYFPVLGIRPALGRLLGPEDTRVIGESPAVVLSYAYWQTRFGGDPDVLGQTMVVNGHILTIVGVAPRGFDGTTLGDRPQVFVPITMRRFMDRDFNLYGDRFYYWTYLFARLKPGVTLEQASTVINGQYHAIINHVEAPLLKGSSDQTMAWFRAKPIVLTKGDRGQSQVDNEETIVILSLLLGITALVLISACANVANLLLARGAARADEMTIRLSIGASRLQIVTQLLAESFLLAVFAGAAGILVSQWTLDMVISLLPAEVASTVHFSLNSQALVYAAILTLGTGMLFGLFPALQTARPELMLSLRGQGGQPSGTRSSARFRAVLAMLQIAFSLALLAVAGLFMKSLFNISRVSIGMTVDNVITFGVSPSRNGYTNPRSLKLYERLEDELAALPGVDSVTSSGVRLLSNTRNGFGVTVEGYRTGPDTDAFSWYNKAGPGYFRTLGIPLIAGREFLRSDAPGSPNVAIVNEAFADKFNLGRNAVGKHIGDGRFGPALNIEIVGLVQNAKFFDVKTPVGPIFFRPYAQDSPMQHLTFYVRTSLSPDRIFPGIKKLMAQLDPNLPLEDLSTFRQQLREHTFTDRLIYTLSATFAALATLLAGVGLFGVLAYMVAQRTREIGVRIALGATQAQVRALVLRQVGMTMLIGGAVGLVGAVVLGRLVQSMLFQLQGYDPGVLFGAAAVLTLVAFTAGFLPAHRASKIDPMRALRCE